MGKGAEGKDCAAPQYAREQDSASRGQQYSSRDELRPEPRAEFARKSCAGARRASCATCAPCGVARHRAPSRVVRASLRGACGPRRNHARDPPLARHAPGGAARDAGDPCTRVPARRALGGSRKCRASRASQRRRRRDGAGRADRRVPRGWAREGGQVRHPHRAGRCHARPAGRATRSAARRRSPLRPRRPTCRGPPQSAGRVAMCGAGARRPTWAGFRENR